jgi:hypothetical protein
VVVAAAAAAVVVVVVVVVVAAAAAALVVVCKGANTFSRDNKKYPEGNKNIHFSSFHKNEIFKNEKMYTKCNSFGMYPTTASGFQFLDAKILFSVL